MDIKKVLADFKVEIDQEIESFLEKTIKDFSQKDKMAAESLRYIKRNILAGGKRLRPAIMYFAYLGAGGKEKKEILKTCVSIELVHAFLLIHDDIIDRDTKRHSKDTINEIYRKIGKIFFPKDDPVHFGNSIAIIAGDMLAALGNQILFNSNFEPERVIKALYKLQDAITLTVIGQYKDVYMGYRKKAREKDVLDMYEYKTARYTIESPLHLGGILAGASREIAEGFTRLAIPLGIAFQIRDDILGVFGSEKKTGKPVGADIREGKQTILVVKAFEKANPDQKKDLKNILGKKNLNEKDINVFRDIIISTGSLEYANAMAKKLIQKGKSEIEKLAIKNESKNFLLTLADYISTREV